MVSKFVPFDKGATKRKFSQCSYFRRCGIIDQALGVHDVASGFDEQTSCKLRLS